MHPHCSQGRNLRRSARPAGVSSFSFRAPFTALAALLTALGGCAAAGAQKDIARLEQGLNGLRSIQAEQTSKIETIETELRNLAGRIEVMEHGQQQKYGQDNQDIRILRDDLSNLRQRVPPPPIVPTAALDADEAFARGLGTESSRLFSDGLLFVRDGKFQEATSLFSSILESGSDQVAPYALFWSGVAYDGLGDNRNALRSYNDLISNYPKHQRAPLALLRQASVFIRMGDSQTASLTLKKLIGDFPKAPEAAQAKEKLKDLPAPSIKSKTR